MTVEVTDTVALQRAALEQVDATHLAAEPGRSLAEVRAAVGEEARGDVAAARGRRRGRNKYVRAATAIVEIAGVAK